MKQQIECPWCNGQADLQKEARELTYRNEVVKIVAHFYQCERCREEFTTTETDSISLAHLHNRFYEKGNTLFSE